MKPGLRLYFTTSILCMLTLISFAHSNAKLTRDSNKPKVIYGEDNRRDIYEERDPFWINKARSVASLFPKNALKKSHDRYELKAMRKYRDMPKRGIPLCEEERFLDQVTAADCTGFLVGKNQILTAGHCIRTDQDCKKNLWVFDYKMKNGESLDQAFLNSSNIYECKKIIKRQDSEGLDFTLVQLDRDVLDREILKSTDEEVPKDDELLVIGSPAGLPLKISDQGHVLSEKPRYYYVNLDTFGGNSGSPVFLKSSGEVIGMLTFGKEDYYFDRQAQCVRTNHCDSEGFHCDVREYGQEKALKIGYLKQQ